MHTLGSEGDGRYRNMKICGFVGSVFHLSVQGKKKKKKKHIILHSHAWCNKNSKCDYSSLSIRKESVSDIGSGNLKNKKYPITFITCTL